MAAAVTAGQKMRHTRTHLRQRLPNALFRIGMSRRADRHSLPIGEMSDGNRYRHVEIGCEI
jgi:hypothetical protein